MKLAHAQEKYPLLDTKPARLLFKRFPADADVIYKDIAAQTFFIQEGENCEGVYILLKGMVISSWDLPGRDDYLFTNDKPLAFLGDLAYFARLAHYHTSVSTVKRTQMLHISSSTFGTWMRSDPKLMEELITGNLQMLLHQTIHRRASGELDNKLRLERYLSWYCKSQLAAGKAFPITVQKTREEIVNDINRISIRTVNRTLARLTQEKQIGMFKGKITVNMRQFQALELAVQEQSI